MRIISISVFMLLACFLLFPISVLAGSVGGYLSSDISSSDLQSDDTPLEELILEGVEITGGFLKDSEVTFDEKRNLVGFGIDV